MRFTVTEWILTRYDDPYEGVRREEGFPNLWFGIVVRTGDAAVVCSYWIEESRHVVRCVRSRDCRGCMWSCSRVGLRLTLPRECECTRTAPRK